MIRCIKGLLLSTPIFLLAILWVVGVYSEAHPISTSAESQGGIDLQPFRFDFSNPPRYSAGELGDGFVAYIDPLATFAADHPSGRGNESIFEFADRTGVDVAINANFNIDAGTGAANSCLGLCGAGGQIIANSSSYSSRVAFVIHNNANLVEVSDRLLAREDRVAIIDYEDIAEEQSELEELAVILNRTRGVEAVVSGNIQGMIAGEFNHEAGTIPGMNDTSSRTLIAYTETGEIVFAVFRTAAYSSRIKSFLETSQPKIKHAVMLDGGASSQMYYRPGFNTLSGLEGFTTDGFNSTHNLNAQGQPVASGRSNLSGAQSRQLYTPLFARANHTSPRSRPAFIGARLSAEAITPDISNGSSADDSDRVEEVEGVEEVDATEEIEDREKREELTITYVFSPGWNAISLPLEIAGVDRASDLDSMLGESGVEVSSISRMRDSRYLTFIPPSQFPDFDEGIDDYTLRRGEGLFIFVENNSGVEIELTGKPLQENSLEELQLGWNFKGGIRGDSERLLTAVAAKDIELASVSGFSNGRFESVVFDGGVRFGGDFVLQPHRGYFLQVRR